MPVPRIAIIGGGPAALSTAFHLTQDPTWRQSYEITVYQHGWRLGGKGATGRDRAPDHGGRLEEHGIHGFCSFYFNTWLMMDEVYRSLTEAEKKLLPSDTIDAAFLPSSLTFTAEKIDGEWDTSVDFLPHTPGDPWENPRPTLGWRAILKRVVDELLRRGRPGPVRTLGFQDLQLPDAPLAGQDPAATIDETILAIDTELDRIDFQTLERPQALFTFDRGLAPLTSLVDRLQELVRQLPVWPRHRDYHRTVTTLDFYAALLRGLTLQVMWASDLDVFDGKDYRAWLRSHRASPHTLESGIAYSVANILFAYPGGDTEQPPQLSTASWLNWVLRSLQGHGQYFYFLRAGTGEAVILPLYLILQRRGVRFEFFHQLRKVHSAELPGGDRVVERLEFFHQATLIDKSGPYTPIEWYEKRSDGRRWKVWPNQPDWSQLEGGKKHGVDFEDWLEDDPLEADRRVLERGQPDGFEYVVWAIPPSMIPLIGDEKLRQTWQRVTTNLTTSATQAAQLWLTHDTNDLGWPRACYPPNSRYASASFPNPMNGMVAFDDLIEEEDWGAGGPKGLIYLCSQWKDLPSSPGRPGELAIVKAITLDLLRQMGDLLPGARDPNNPASIDLAYLYDPQGRSGEERLDFQYFRANTRPTEAYAQAPPGSVQGRLDAWDTGYENLVVAGDWMYNGFNLGSFESAVTGGKLAAFALTGAPEIARIVGYTYLHHGARIRAEQARTSGRVPLIHGLP